MSVAGTYDCVTKSPMGDQNSVFTIIPDERGTSFTGTNASPMGQVEIKDGTINGNTIQCKMDITSPMPMTLECEAVIEGDTLDGSINAGAFGKMGFSGTRQT